jgi:hypothetical protein
VVFNLIMKTILPRMLFLEYLSYFSNHEHFRLILEFSKIFINIRKYNQIKVLYSMKQMKNWNGTKKIKVVKRNGTIRSIWKTERNHRLSITVLSVWTFSIFCSKKRKLTKKNRKSSLLSAPIFVCQFCLVIGHLVVCKKPN